MRVTVSGELIAKLTAHAERVGGHDEVTRSRDAFILDAGLGPVVYLTADGQILIDDLHFWGDDGLREATDDEATIGLNAGARRTGIDELRALIPPPSEGSTRCAACDGSRFVTMHSNDSTFRMVCATCAGRGWVRAST